MAKRRIMLEMQSPIIDFVNTYSNDYQITIKPKCITAYKVEANRIRKLIEEKTQTFNRVKRYVLYYFIVKKFPFLRKQEISILLDCSVWNTAKIEKNIETYYENNFDGIKDSIDKLKELV